MGENVIVLRSDHEDHARWAELRHAKIGRLAYYIWHIGGEQTGRDQVNWLIAEHVFEAGKFRTYPYTETPVFARAAVSALRPESGKSVNTAETLGSRRTRILDSP